MRYYTKQLLQMLNSGDITTRLIAQEQWKANDSVYQKYFNKIKTNLPRNFLEEYMLRQGFHDYSITNISFKHANDIRSCELQLTNEAEIILLTMNGITSMKIDIASFCECIGGEMRWAYNEFEIVSKKLLQLLILCDCEIELQFTFQSIKIKTERRFK